MAAVIQCAKQRIVKHIQIMNAAPLVAVAGAEDNNFDLKSVYRSYNYSAAMDDFPEFH